MPKPKKPKICRWCHKPQATNRVSICSPCLVARDEKNKRIDREGIKSYVPPQERPGHRLYEGPIGKRPRSEKQIAAQVFLKHSRTPI